MQDTQIVRVCVCLREIIHTHTNTYVVFMVFQTE